MADLHAGDVVPAPHQVGQSAKVWEDAVLMWANDRIQEGQEAVRQEPAYKDLDKLIAYVMGDQLDPKRPSGLSSVTINQLKEVFLQSVSALTDVHPLFGYKTKNTAFQSQAELLTNLAQAWWVNRFCDVRLGDVLRYALMCCGYCEVHWDQAAEGGTGDIQLTARDPRDVLPIRPVFGASVQEWEGVILCQTLSVDQARARWRHKNILPDNEGNYAQRVWKTLSMMLSTSQGGAPIAPTSGGFFQSRKRAPKSTPTVDVFTIYFKDRRLHQGSLPVDVGEPNTNWGYTVYPIGWQMPNGTAATEKDARLYPRGRVIITTKHTVLHDGPNPYWHGMFPVAKLSLDPWPWSLWGTGLVKDLLPLQDALNETVNGILDSVRKALRPAVIGDSKALPESLWQRLDTRIPGLKLKTNMSRGRTLELSEGPKLEPYIFDFVQFLITTMKDHAGVGNLMQLQQMATAPAADTIEAMKEQLTPVLRMKGRLMEAFLRDVGEMVKANFFQFYSAPRRVAILGEQGLDLQDFDFDPGNLIPAMALGDSGYSPQYDRSLPTHKRAAVFMTNFAFQVTPNSLLAISQLSRKMMYLQLWRGGLVDPWTLAEVLEIPNMGTPPNGAETIMDRLQAAMLMGVSVQANAAGRPPSGQSPPQLKNKSDGQGGQRQTVTESR